jgi:hypothetical protein
MPPEPDPILTLGIGLPDIDTVREYVQVPVTALPDEDLERIYGAEIQSQQRECHHTDYPECWPAPLAQALLRRVQRQIAARNLPLGVIDMASEFGPARIPLYDAMISNLETSYRRLVVA